MHAFPNGRWSTHPTYQQLEQSAEQFDNQSDSRASRPRIAPALKVSDSPPAHLHVIPGEARAGGGGEAGKAGCRLISASKPTAFVNADCDSGREKSLLSEPVGGVGQCLKIETPAKFEASGGVNGDASIVRPAVCQPTLGTAIRNQADKPDAGIKPGPLASSLSLADQAACSMTIREQINLMRRGDKFHFIALATNLIQVLENERNAVVERIAEMED